MNQKFMTSTSRVGISRLARLSILILVNLLTNHVYGANYIMEEDLLYPDNILNAKSFDFWNLTVSERYYSGVENLSILAIAMNYGSDPDVYISISNTQPTSRENSDIHCERSGNDYCIIQNGKFEPGDLFFIGIGCTDACTYNLKAFYGETYDLPDSVRTTYRFDGYSTNYLKYYNPD